ncbi:MAG: MFS transporter [Bacteroidota bacterium]
MQEKPPFSNRYKWFALGMMTIAGALNFFDRQLVVILQEPIKKDLLLSDTQLGLMSGLAFAIFYCLVGIPIARYADTHNRRNIVGISIGLWSLMTAMTGYVQNFVQMLLVRIGVGVGEAGGSPSSHAMISDYFTKEKRATAFAIFATSVFIGLFLGFLVGGILEDSVGWRKAFFLLGVPGILFAFLFVWLVKEPPKGYSDGGYVEMEVLDFKTALGRLLSKKTYIFVLLASALHSFVGYSFLNWIPSFFVRVHGMAVMEVGIYLAISVGIGGAVGAFLGGLIVDKLVKKDQRWYMWIGIVAITLTIPFSFYVLFASNGINAALCYFIPNILFSLNLGAILTVTQGVVGVQLRALSSAVYYFVINLIGMGMGPVSIGILSDVLLPTYGDYSLRYALLGVSFVYLICIYFYWKAGTYLEAEMVG